MKVSQLRGIKFVVNDGEWCPADDKERRKAFKALDDVAQGLGFVGVDSYNNWCETCTPKEFKERLASVK